MEVDWSIICNGVCEELISGLLILTSHRVTSSSPVPLCDKDKDLWTYNTDMPL